MKIELGFDLDAALKELKEAEPNEEGFVSIFLGSVFRLTPSGKYYMPWACGNLTPCDGCGGTGKCRLNVSPRRAKKWKNRQAVRRTWVQRYGAAWNWPPHIRRRSDRLNQFQQRGSTTCPNCCGHGSCDANRDERWQALVKKTLEPHGCWIENGEGDPTDLFLCSSREKEETNDGSE